MSSSTANRKQVLVVIGTRPEAIKLAPVISELDRNNFLSPLVCTTGQHREMLEQMLAVFNIRPQHILQVMKPEQSLSDVTAAVLAGMDKLLREIRVDCTIVQGDTTTAFAAALESFYHRIPVGHVEAGLRTDDRYNPFPEEINRRLISPICSYHFAPTQLAARRLLSENIPGADLVVTGNTVIDALLQTRTKLEQGMLVPRENYLANIDGKRLVVVTAHRRENFGGALEEICQAIRALATSRSDIHIAYPVHLNPNVSRPVGQFLNGLSNVSLLPPLDYVSFVDLMMRATILLTDSGGIQEEGPALGKPVLVMRNVSERPEAIETGSAKLVGTRHDVIVSNVNDLLDDKEAYARMINRPNPFGDGRAAEKIVQFLEQRLA